ncbi:MAG: nucleotidyltransferase family protein [Arcicella sp.]|jgi:molybdenum cofactor cytidylyltransferase|nr:nucleotidyltransferase family protein [Arcicella sp.]
MNLSIIILAAGNSSRLGQPKQLIEYQGESLIRRITALALSVTSDVKVVLGANADIIRENLQSFASNIQIVDNPNWQQGMGTSIQKGVASMTGKEDATLILLSDQPFVNFNLLQEILQTFAENSPQIVACDYGNQIGVPMLFDKVVFHQLLQLKGDKGARSFLKEFQGKIATVPFPEGMFDIDTPNDLNELRKIEDRT